MLLVELDHEFAAVWKTILQIDAECLVQRILLKCSLSTGHVLMLFSGRKNNNLGDAAVNIGLAGPRRSLAGGAAAALLSTYYFRPPTLQQPQAAQCQ